LVGFVLCVPFLFHTCFQFLLSFVSFATGRSNMMGCKPAQID